MYISLGGTMANFDGLRGVEIWCYVKMCAEVEDDVDYFKKKLHAFRDLA